MGDLGGGNGGENLGLCLHSALVLNPCGLCLHSALVLNPCGLPLGLVGQELWPPAGHGHRRRYPLEEKENYWAEALGWVKQYLSGVKQVVLVSARESDFYEYFSSPRPANAQLLFRVHHLQRYVFWQGERMGRLHRCRPSTCLAA